MVAEMSTSSFPRLLSSELGGPMQPKALMCDEKQDFSIRDIILKDLGSDEVLIRTAYSGVSIGTEFALIRNKISWGPYPL